MTYGGLVSFGDYTFTNLGKYRDNFAQAKPQTASFPGMDGGWNVDGAGGPITPVGRVTQSFTIVAATRAEMDDLRDELNALRFLGENRLVYQPTDTADSSRWTWAAVQNIQTNDTNIRGGISGSWPIDGKYHPYQYPNWAAKFFIDALLSLKKAEKGSRQPFYPG